MYVHTKSNVTNHTNTQKQGCPDNAHIHTTLTLRRTHDDNECIHTCHATAMSCRVMCMPLHICAYQEQGDTPHKHTEAGVP